MVGLVVLRSTAPSIRVAPPNSSTRLSAFSGVASVPASSPTAASSVFIVGVSRTGHSWAPIRATAAARSVTAFSRLIIDPWPARPRAVSRIQAMPFSAASIRYIRRPRTVVLKPPTSPTASVQPSSSSRWSSTRTCAPLWPPASSSAVKQSTIGRAGTRPYDGEQHGVEVLHVDRTAAPHVAVLDLAGERVDLPVLRGGGYDVEVAVEQQRSPVPGRPAAPVRQDRGPARLGLVEAGLDADLVEQRGDVLGRLPLPRAVLVAVVGGVHPDQLSTELDHLGGRVLSRVVRCLFGVPCVASHDPILTPVEGGRPIEGFRASFATVPPHSSGWRNWQTR